MKELSMETIEAWLRDADWHVRCAAMEACWGREVPLSVLEPGLRDTNRFVRSAAMKACRGRDVPLSFIEAGLREARSSWSVSHAALEACRGREVPFSVLEAWLQDPDLFVRGAAIEVCKEKGIKVPPSRTFEPPKRVYKKCLSGVIVVAEIPADAHVRGGPGQECRASKARIVNVIGTVCGEPVGISWFDSRVLYCAGDEIEVENFDHYAEKEGRGFHFFCTREEAEKYDPAAPDTPAETRRGRRRDRHGVLGLLCGWMSKAGS